MIQSVVFDVDDTIYDQQEPFHKAVQEVFPFVSAKDWAALYLRFRFHSDENFCKVIRHEWSLVDMRNYRIRASLKDLGYSAISEETAERFQQIYEDALGAIAMHEEVRKTLDFLKESAISIAIITNGPTDHQYKKIMQLGLLDWVKDDQIIISEAAGYEKPDVNIFKLAEKQFDLAAEYTLYVGDNYHNDVQGCKRAGWQSLWFNHRHRKVPETSDWSEDVEITSFQELLPAIKKMLS